MMGRLTGAAVVLGLMVAAGCGGGGGGGGQPDSSMMGNSCTSPPARDDAGATTCHDLVNCGPSVPFVAASGSAPTPMGGALPSGLYVLTGARVYGAASAPVSLRVTQLWSGSTVQAINFATGSQELRSTVAVQTSGTMLTETVTCPTGGGMMTRPYTSTATGWLDFDTDTRRTIVYEYTKVQ